MTEAIGRGARSLRWQQALLCWLAALAVARQCLAAEGFFTGEPPPAVRAIWPSVYAFVCEGRQGAYTASAFLVKKVPRGKSADYFFVTAGHAVEDCKFPRRYLTEDLGQPRFESDGITIRQPSPRLANPQTVRVDDAYDIAVIKVTARADLRIGAPLKVDATCDKALRQEIYAVGFPGVTRRPSLRMDREVKRWSRGAYVGLGRAEFRGILSTYLASSVDSLPGSSGGPVVDADGVLVGVVSQGAANDENGFRYDVDPQKRDDWQTFLVPCHEVLRIMSRSQLD
jgi:S1-C subfamily serine protease